MTNDPRPSGRFGRWSRCSSAGCRCGSGARRGGRVVGLVAAGAAVGGGGRGDQAHVAGPVFFRQKRSGLGGKEFWMLKFRSMVADAEARKRQLLALNEQDGPAFKIKDDPRVTRLGRFLRSHQHRRVAAIVERAARRDVAGRSAPAALRRDGGLPRLAPPALGRDPRPDVHLAGARAVDGLLRRLGPHGRAVHPLPVAWADVKLLLQTVPAVVSRRGAS